MSELPPSQPSTADSNSEAKMRALLRVIPDLMFRLDSEGRFLEFYTADDRLLFVSPEQIVGNTVHQLLPEPVASKLMAGLARTQEQSSIQTVEYSLPVASEHSYFEARLVAMGAHETLAIVRDITTRRKAEEAIRASEKQYRMLMERASEATFISDPIGQFLAVNHQACRLLNRSESELLSVGVMDLIPEEDRASTRLQLAALREENPVQFERTILNLDGHPLQVDISASRMPDGRIQAIVRDISARKRAEDALRKSEESFRLLFERFPDLIAVQRDGVVIWANEACAKAFQTTVEGFLGRKVLDLIHPDDRQTVADRIRRQSITQQPSFEEERLIRQDGSIWLAEITAIPHVFHGKLSNIVIIRDITDRRRAEEERRRMESRGQHAQKLQSLGIMAGGIAHDFNNLLMGVLGNTSLALAESPPEAPAREYLLRIEKTVRRASDLTRQLLAYTGKGHVLVEALDISKAVEEMTHLLETVISKKASLHFDFHPHLPPVEADATQLRQVIMNLITNASDALDNDEGTISVRTKSMWADANYLFSTYLDNQLEVGDYVVLEVSDSGIGMDQQTIDKIFDPFFTTKSSGRGLGLAAVLGIVKGHGGTLKVNSNPGQGTCITVLLPPSKKTTLVPSTRPQPQCGTILIADDEESVRNMTRFVLEQKGVSVLTAADGMEAIDLFQKHKQHIGLVILDMAMPRMSGKDVLQVLRTLDPKVKAVLTSSHTEQESIEEFAEVNPLGFIYKPYTPEEFLTRVAQILGRDEPA